MEVSFAKVPTCRGRGSIFPADDSALAAKRLLNHSQNNRWFEASGVSVELVNVHVWGMLEFPFNFL